MSLAPMKIEISKIIFEEVKLSSDNVKEVVKRALSRHLLPADVVGEDGILYSWDDSFHGSPIKCPHGAATDLQKAVYTVLKNIDDVLK